MITAKDSDLDTTTTNGKTFTGAQHAALAVLIFQRWGCDAEAACVAWRRLFQNSTTVRAFQMLVDAGLAASRTACQACRGKDSDDCRGCGGSGWVTTGGLLSMTRWVEQGRVLLPQHERGVDWSRPRALVLRDGRKEVFWVPGHVSWAGIGMRDYYEGTLVGVDKDARAGSLSVGTTFAEGGRLIRHLREPDVLQKIATFMGVAVADLPAFKNGKSYVTWAPPA